MDPQRQFCHNLECTARGQLGLGNISVHGRADYVDGDARNGARTNLRSDTLRDLLRELKAKITSPDKTSGESGKTGRSPGFYQSL